MKPTPDCTYCFSSTCLESQPYDAAICQNCGSSLLLQDRYRAIQILGQSRSGRTYLAVDLGQTGDNILPVRCVIKQSWYDSSSEIFDRISPHFQQAVKRLHHLGQHAQIPAVLDSFEQDFSFYLVQEYIQGKSLSSLLVENGQLCAAEIWQILESLLPLLQWIHDQGVIHGDIRPGNIIARSPHSLTDLALVDFGISTLLSEDAIGSPEYAAPEQVRGQAEFASDLYSLGVTCIHLLTGIHPFHLFNLADGTWAWQHYWIIEATNSAAVYEQQHLAQILDRLIAPELSQRYASAAEAITDLQKSGSKKYIPPVTKPLSIWECAATLTGHQGVFGNVNAVAIAPDNETLASASDDKTIRIWNLLTTQELFILRGHSHSVKTIAFHPFDSSVMVSGSHDRTIKIWNLQTHEITQTLTGHQNAVNAVAFNPVGEVLASGSADKTVKFWHPATGALLTTLKGHSLAVHAIAFSPSAPLLASASSDKTVQIWNCDTQQTIYTISQHTWAVRAVAFSPNGALLATGSEDRTIRLWKIDSWQCIHTFSHPWTVSALTFSPDGTFLISASWDKTIKLWHIGTGQEAATLTGHTDSVNSVAIAPNGSRIASSSKDKTIKLWKLAHDS